MVSSDCTEIGQQLEVSAYIGNFQATVVEKPFYDPKKKIAAI